MQNPFDNAAFSMASLTAAINIIPNRYGRLEALGLGGAVVAVVAVGIGVAARRRVSLVDALLEEANLRIGLATAYDVVLGVDPATVITL